MSDANRTLLRRLAEVTWNTTPAAAMTETRFTSESLAFNIAMISSQEIRADRQVSDLVQVGADSSGDVGIELSYGSYDDLLEGALFSAWGTAFDEADVDIDADAADDSFNKAGADFATTLVPGQFIYVQGFTEAANNGWHQVVSATASKIVVTTALTTEAAGDAVTMKGTHLRNGVTRKSFTLEKEFADKTQFLAYRGMTVNTFNLSVAANAIATGSFSFMGGAATRSGVTTGTGAANAASTTQVMNGVSHLARIFEGGAALSGVFAQSLTMSLGNNVRPIDAIGTLGHVDLGVGTIDVTGTLTVYFEDGTLYDKYLANTETSFSFEMSDDAGNRYHIAMPRIKYSAGVPMAGGLNQDVMLPLQFQALRHATYGHTIQIDRVAA